MATVKVRFRVRELSNVMTQFDQIKVYRSDAEAGIYRCINRYANTTHHV